MCWAHASLCRKLTRGLPTKTALVFNCLKSSHTLSHTHTIVTNKSHIKYRVHKIKHNYNQIWHEIKANHKIVVNYNFTVNKEVILSYSSLECNVTTHLKLKLVADIKLRKEVKECV